MLRACPRPFGIVQRRIAAQVILCQRKLQGDAMPGADSGPYEAMVKSRWTSGTPLALQHAAARRGSFPLTP